jgi:exodeoxyribonuclease (lambda-induced)
MPTASEFGNIVTPGGKLSEGSRTYLYRLLSERILGYPEVQVTTALMDRGSAMEETAVADYEFLMEVETQKCGIFTDDLKRYGASPDRLVGDVGLMEIKCPASGGKHMSYLLGDAGVDKTYKPQVQGQLWICQREWVDSKSYFPGLPDATVRAYRDDAYIALLEKSVMEFVEVLDAATEKLRADGIIREKPKAHGAEFLTDEQAEALYIHMRDVEKVFA